jgi:hypothetical protein
MGVEMSFSFLDTYGLKYLSTVAVILIASSTLLENLAKMEEVKNNVVRQEKFLDAAFMNKIFGTVLAMVVAFFAFGAEPAVMFAIGTCALVLVPFVIFKTPSDRRRAAYAKLEFEAEADKLRNEKIDALIEAERLRTSPNQGGDVGESVDA